MKALKAVILIFTVLVSCKEAPKDPAPLPAERTAQPRDLTIIEGYTGDIRGCSCTFSRNPEEYRQQRFIYLEKYGSTNPDGNFRMLSLDGKPIRWRTGESPEGFEVEIRYDSETVKDQEVREIEGKLVLRFPDGSAVESPVYGYCGC